MPNGVYQWLTMANAVSQLAQRLSNFTNNAANQYWTPTELQIYISQSLRMYNVLTYNWSADFQFSPTTIWNNLGSISGCPRQRTLLDTYAYTELEYMLLEPPTGQAWSGTTQFSISDISQALQRRRDEMLQVGNANQSLMSGINLTPNTIRTQLPDSVIDVARVRYLPVITSATGAASSGVRTVAVNSTVGVTKGQLVGGTGLAYYSTVTDIGSGTISISLPTIGTVSGTLNFFTPNTLNRDDTIANQFYKSPLYQLQSGTPYTFSLSSEPPLSWDVDRPPNLAGNYEAVVLQSGAAFQPPTPTLIGIPDDFVWGLEWGAIADLLGRESEATDRERAAYAMQRYQDALQLFRKAPWVLLGTVNGAAVSIDSIYAMDRYSPEWDSNATGFGPVIVSGGIDMIGVPLGGSIGLTLLGNAPILDSTSNYVQISRSDADIMFDLAQARACFKMGGAEWKAALELEQRALQACAAENTRLKSLGAFSDVLIQRGGQQERDMNRYNKRGDRD